MITQLRRQIYATLVLYYGERPNYRIPQRAVNRFKLKALTKGLIRHDQVCRNWTDQMVDDCWSSMGEANARTIYDNI
jgi:hypothetical protein